MPRVAIVVLTLLLLLTTCLPRLPAEAGSGTSSIDTSQPYASGYINGSQGAWYTWVNVQGVKLVFLALYSPVYNSPVFTFVGQEYNSSSGGPVFVGNALMLMEVFNDTNHNGILDANYTAGHSELKYTVIMNSSQSFTPVPVSENSSDGISHSHWGMDYQGIDAFLIIPDNQSFGYGGGVAASKVALDHFAVSYDYSVTDTTARLESKYDIGNFTLVPNTGNQPGNHSVNLNGLSLALFFSTVTISLKKYSVEETALGPSGSLLANARVLIENSTAFEFLFNDSYTLYQTPPSGFNAEIASASPDSVPSFVTSNGWFSPVLRVQDYLRSLPIYGGLPNALDLNYSHSGFLYRLSFEQWSGHPLTEDPTFIAYVSLPRSALASFPISLVVVAGVSGILLTAIAIVDVTRRKKSPFKQTNEDSRA